MLQINQPTLDVEKISLNYSASKMINIKTENNLYESYEII